MTTTELSAGTGTRAIERALDIVDAIAAGPAPIRLTDIARITSFSKPTAYRLLGTLTARGLVARHEEGYTLGARLSQWSEDARPGSRLYGRLTPFLLDLFERTGGAVCLGTVEEQTVRYSPSIHDWTHPVRPPLAAPLHECAAGILFLAHDPALAKGAAAGSAPELADVRTRGVVVRADPDVRGEVETAAPVFTGDGRIIAAIRVAGPDGRLALEETATQVIRTARLATAMLAGHDAHQPGGSTSEPARQRDAVGADRQL